MLKLFAILLCKLIRIIGNLVGRGSSLPGQFALKVCPDILSRIKLPEDIIAITGSNGKTSTTEMVYSLLKKQGRKVAYNSEGSNQIEGITTLIIDNCDLGGNFLKDVLLMEVDERYAKYVCKYITPKYYIINNLYRDQMTRNGHPEYVLNDIKKSISPATTLVLNSDDPIISSLAKEFANDVIFFGINDSTDARKENDAVYDDGYYCPLCHHKMIYDYRVFAHVGSYRCSNCDFHRETPEYAISKLDLANSKITINGRYEIGLALNTIFNAYNVLVAFAIGSLIGLDEEKCAQSLDDYLIRNGRFRNFKVGDRQGTLLISKHENTISYNTNLEYVASCNGDVSLLLIIDDISRKYFTSDTSWLWDISFEYLQNSNVKKIAVAGKYINDVAVRFTYAGIDMNKVELFKEAPEAIRYIAENAEGNFFALTCFSDEGKLLKEVEVL